MSDQTPPQEPSHIDDSPGTGPGSEGPGPSSEAPGTTEPQAGVTKERPEPVFNEPDIRADFETILEVGRLEETFEWGGHEFTIKTLPIGEILEIGLMTKQYQGTVSDMRAYTTAVVAAALIEVNGEPVAVPLDNQPYGEIRSRFQHIRKNWYPPIIDVIYDRYMALEGRARAVVEQLLAQSGQTNPEG